MVDVFVEAMRGPLEAIGFVKRACGNLFTSDFGGDMVGWVGLNTASAHYPKGIRAVHPNVGVRHQFVARWHAALRGETSDIGPTNYHGVVVYVDVRRGLPLLGVRRGRRHGCGGAEHNRRCRRVRTAVDPLVIPLIAALEVRQLDLPAGRPRQIVGQLIERGLKSLVVPHRARSAWPLGRPHWCRSAIDWQLSPGQGS